MPRLRHAPWLLTALALAAVLYTYAPDGTFNKIIPYLIPLAILLLTALALALAILALRRRRRLRPPADPHTARQARRALDQALAAARRALGGAPARTWLLLGPSNHGKSTLATALLGELRDLTPLAATPALRCLVAPDTRTLVLEHPGTPCDLHALLRLRRPLDAILIVLSLPDLDPTFASLLRPRIQSLLDTLAVDVPIHLVCTKLDHLAGHGDLVSDTTPWSLALASSDHLPAALRAWSRWVDAQRLARLANEPRPEPRTHLFTFAAAFARACDRLVDLTPLFANLPLRTASFIALRRDPAPRDVVLHDLAAQLHLPLRSRPAAPATSPLIPQPALLTTLLAHDREVTRAPAHHRRRARHHAAFAAALTLAALAISVSAPAAATRHQTCLQTIADATAPLAADTLDLPALHALLSTPDCADPHALDATFRRAVRRHLLLPHHTNLEKTLTRLTAHPPLTVTDQLAARDALRAYLLLTADLSERPGPLDPDQTTWLATYLATPETTPLLTAFFPRAESSDIALPRNTTLVAHTRQLLNTHSDDDATLHAALAAADAACEPLALRALTHAAQLTAARTLPCSFTRPGWDLVQRQLALTVDRHDRWILGRPPEPRDERLARLRDRYDARYIAAWTEFLAGIRVRRPTDPGPRPPDLPAVRHDRQTIKHLRTGADISRVVSYHAMERPRNCAHRGRCQAVRARRLRISSRTLLNTSPPTNR